MQRITITVEDEFMEEIDRLIREKNYQSRSEAIRDMARMGARQLAEEAGAPGECIGALVYVYEYGTRDLSRRLTTTFHEHHDLSLTSVRLHLDHDNCMEVAVLRGNEVDVQHLADHVIAEKGVRYGRLVRIPVSTETELHKHTHGQKPHRHLHTHVLKI